MAAPVSLAVRVFEQQVSRHEANARNEVASVHRRVESIAHDVNEGGTVTALGAAKNLARDVADLISHLSARAVLKDLAFLATEEKR